MAAAQTLLGDEGSGSIGLTDLAPVDLRPLRPVRFDGNGFGLTLGDFAPEDRDLFRDLYRTVKGFYESWLAAGDDATRTRLIRSLDSEFLFTTGSTLGQASTRAGLLSDKGMKVLHDARGGGLVLLIGAAKLLAVVDDHGLLSTCGYAARDHTKIMRNALVDLAPPGRAQDMAARAHTVEGFLAPWREAAERIGDRDIRVDARATFHGAVAGCCLEASAVDRVVYNLVNNAARFTADGHVALNVFETPNGLTRWVISNALGADERRWLEERVGPNLGELYQGRVTHGGTGVGLSTCADLVAASCGVPSGREAVEQGYVGARIVGDLYHAWFHWPVYGPP